MDAVQVAGLRIAYQRTGHGPALVLLHGAYEDSRAWRPQLQALSDEFTVFAWDAPGCGSSDDHPPDFSGKDLGDALAGFLREAVPGRPHVLGLSGVALEPYRGYPERHHWCWPPRMPAGRSTQRSGGSCTASPAVELGLGAALDCRCRPSLGPGRY